MHFFFKLQILWTLFAPTAFDGPSSLPTADWVNWRLHSRRVRLTDEIDGVRNEGDEIVSRWLIARYRWTFHTHTHTHKNIPYSGASNFCDESTFEFWKVFVCLFVRFFFFAVSTRCETSSSCVPTTRCSTRRISFVPTGSRSIASRRRSSTTRTCSCSSPIPKTRPTARPSRRSPPNRSAASRPNRLPVLIVQPKSLHLIGKKKHQPPKKNPRDREFMIVIALLIHCIMIII